MGTVLVISTIDPKLNQIIMSGQHYFPRRCYITVEGSLWLLKDHAPKCLMEYLNTLTEGDEYVECETIGLKNEYPDEYDELWLVEGKDDEIIPVIIANINTSSPIAMWSCGIAYYDERYDEYEEDVEGITLDQLVEKVGKGWRRGLRTVMEKNKY